MWRAVRPSSCISGLHPGQPTWKHMQRTHLSQPSPASHQLHGRWFPCQKDRRHRSVVHGCKDAAHTKYIFSSSHLRAEADDLFFLLFLPFVRCHFCASSPDSATGKRGWERAGRRVTLLSRKCTSGVTGRGQLPEDADFSVSKEIKTPGEHGLLKGAPKEVRAWVS